MKRRELEVRRAALSVASPWAIPAGVEPVSLVDSSSGEQGRLRTEVAAFHDGRVLYFVFALEDDEVRATIYGRDSELWREDVVEVFLQPGRPDTYFEFEASPNGSLFDARIRFPGPTRDTMTVDTGWDCPGFHSWIRRTADQAGRGLLEILLTIPFSSMGGAPPRLGDAWRGNLYRIDRSSRGDLFAAWSPTLTPRPDFHVPERFGTIVFV